MSSQLSAVPSQPLWSKWKPKLLEVLPGYRRQDFAADLISGITVGMVALPLALAFGIASGVTPQAGLFTAIVGGFLVSLLGGSKVQIGGPTGAFVVIVAGIIAQHGISGLYMVTMMAGVILLFLGITGLGTAVRFIPRPIVIGFTNGIALLIASTQIKDFLGMKTKENPSEFFQRMKVIGENLGATDWVSLGLGAASLAVILLIPKLFPRIPGAIVALLGGTAAVALFGLPVETIGTRFGGIGHGLPNFQIPAFRADLILPLLPSAMTVAILAAVESLLSAVVADGMTGDRHNSNAELMAQGIANIASPLVGGIPVTGAIARTATNVRAGARSPVSGIIHALTLLAIVLALAPLAKFIPMATLAAVLFVVAYNMGEWREIAPILRLSNADRSVWFITFVLTVVADLTVAVEVGMALASLLYIYQIAQTTTVGVLTSEDIESGREHMLQDKEVPHFVTILRVHGPFLFGVTEKLLEETGNMEGFAPIVMLRLRHMTAIDATGLHALEQLSDRCKKSGRTLLLCGAREQPARMLERADVVERIGSDNILPNAEAALDRAREIYEATPPPALAK